MSGYVIGCFRLQRFELYILISISLSTVIDWFFLDSLKAPDRDNNSFFRLFDFNSVNQMNRSTLAVFPFSNLIQQYFPFETDRKIVLYPRDKKEDPLTVLAGLRWCWRVSMLKSTRTGYSVSKGGNSYIILVSLYFSPKMKLRSIDHSQESITFGIVCSFCSSTHISTLTRSLYRLN